MAGLSALAQAIMHSLCASPWRRSSQQDGSITSPAIVLTPSLPDAGAPFVEEDLAPAAVVFVVVVVPAVSPEPSPSPPQPPAPP
jgi:hypothetical protein